MAYVTRHIVSVLIALLLILPAPAAAGGTRADHTQGGEAPSKCVLRTVTLYTSLRGAKPYSKIFKALKKSVDDFNGSERCWQIHLSHGLTSSEKVWFDLFNNDPGPAVLFLSSLGFTQFALPPHSRQLRIGLRLFELPRCYRRTAKGRRQLLTFFNNEARKHGVRVIDIGPVMFFADSKMSGSLAKLRSAPLPYLSFQNDPIATDALNGIGLTPKQQRWGTMASATNKKAVGYYTAAGFVEEFGLTKLTARHWNTYAVFNQGAALVRYNSKLSGNGAVLPKVDKLMQRVSVTLSDASEAAYRDLVSARNRKGKQVFLRANAQLRKGLSAAVNTWEVAFVSSNLGAWSQVYRSRC